MTANLPTTPSPKASDWIAGARPRTLPAAVVPVAVGAACAAGAGDSFGDVVWWRVVGALVVSLLLQVGVNYANDYSDGVRGTDDVRVGPLRLVASGAATSTAVKRAALLAFGLAAVVGLVLAIATSWWLLLVGALAIFAAWGYTGGPRPYGYLGLGEFFVFVFFGLVATAGTAYLAIKQVPPVTWVAATAVGFLACALLVINNLRDIPTDALVGKKTLAVRLGAAHTRVLYGALVVGAFVLSGVASGWRTWAVIAVGSAIVAIRPIRIVAGGATGHSLIQALSDTGKTQLAFGLLFSIGLAVG
jgi:1,4-dihydroxy-2-naphthoate octaprenyltransferase